MRTPAFGGGFQSAMVCLFNASAQGTTDLTGRMVELQFLAYLGSVPFNIDSGTGSYEAFISGTACNLVSCITGSAVTPSGTPNEFKVALVSAGELGAAWDVFENTSYFEVWESQNTITLLGPATVPIPATVWLFGSGLLGLIDIARRKAA